MVSRNEINLPYGLRDGALVHIADATKGLACGCVCPGCKERLVARKGAIKIPHFAHHASEPCAHGLETALHLASKAILAKRREIVLPKVELSFSTYRDALLVAPERRYVLDEVRAECRTEDIVPDLLVLIKNHRLLIEIRVTHAVDGTKLRKIDRLGIAAIEVDYSSLLRDFSDDALTELLVNQTTHKKWIYNPVPARLKQHLLSSGERKPIIERRCALHVDNCPIQSRVWRGKSYANVIDDCLYCPHSLDIDANNTHGICGGRLKLASIAQIRVYARAHRLSDAVD